MAGTKGKDKDGDAPKKLSKKAQLAIEQQRLLDEAAKAEQLENERIQIAEQKQKEHEEQRKIEQENQLQAENLQLLQQGRYDVRYVDRLKTIAKSINQSINDAADWHTYLECSPLPDVRSESALNTWLSLYYDEPSQSINPLNLLHSLISSCSSSESLVQAVQKQLNIAREQCDMSTINMYMHYQRILRDLSICKIDSLTSSFLSLSDEYEDPETRVYSVSAASEHVHFGLWIHSSAKHGRAKKIEWPSIDLHIELPVAMQQSRIAIRAIRTSFDHHSCYSEYVGPLITNTENNDLWNIVNQHQANNDNHSDDQSINQSDSDEAVDRSSVERLVKAALCPAYHFISLGGLLSIEQLALPAPAKEAKQWRMREINSLSTTVQSVPYPAEEVAQTNAADPNVANNQPINQSNNQFTAPAAVQAQAPLRVSLRLPNSIFMSNELPPFGWWDSHAAAWRQDGINLIEYDPSTGSALIALHTLKPFALIQPRALDFPYRQWTIKQVERHADQSINQIQSTSNESSDQSINQSIDSVQPVDADRSTEIMVRGSRFDVIISINQSGHAHLAAPTHPLLASVNNIVPARPSTAAASAPAIPRSPGELLHAMTKLGINVAPSVSDAEYCRKPVKNASLLQIIHANLSQVIGVFEISGFELNTARNERTALFKVRVDKASADLKSSRARRDMIVASLNLTDVHHDDQSIDASVDRAIRNVVQQTDLVNWFVEGDDSNPPVVAIESSTEIDSSANQAIDDIDLRTPEQKAADDAKAAEAAAALKVAQEKADEEARLAREQDMISQSLSQAARIEQSYQWHVVMATLTEIDGSEIEHPSGKYVSAIEEKPVEPVPAPQKPQEETKEIDDGLDSDSDEPVEQEEKEQADTLVDTVPDQAETETSLPPPESSDSVQTDISADVNPPSVIGEPEEFVAGVPIVRFQLITGLNSQGQIDMTPVQTLDRKTNEQRPSRAHCSLRRCLIDHFDTLVDSQYDLAVALDRLTDRPGNREHPAFLPLSESTIIHQQAVRKALNLMQPFNFF